jgi:hypothetical protein
VAAGTVGGPAFCRSDGRAPLDVLRSRAQSVPAAAPAYGRMTGVGQQILYPDGEAGQLLTSSSAALHVLYREHHTERQAVEQDERAEQHAETQSDDLHDPMVPGRNRTSLQARPEIIRKC